MKAKLTCAAAAALAAALGLAPALQAQDGEQAELVAKREQKLEGEWLKNAAWITDYDEARAEAKATGKQIFAYFTRSYSP